MIDYILMLTDGRLFKTTARHKSEAFNNVFNQNFNVDDDVLYDQPTFMDSVSHIEWQGIDAETNTSIYYLQDYFNGNVIYKSHHSKLIPYYNAQFNQIELPDEETDGTEI
jgi:hypothetical protein